MMEADAAHEGRVVTLRSERLWLRDDGIVQAVLHPGTMHTRADAESGVAAIGELTGQTRHPLLVDLRQAKGMDRDARTYYAGAGQNDAVRAVALLVGSPLTRMIAGFIMGVVGRRTLPTRIFTSEPDAVAWLLEFIR